MDGPAARGNGALTLFVVRGAPCAAIMPVDVPEEDWESLQIVFATSDGDVRRNALSDFTNVMRNGKIAMKLPDAVSLVRARICTEEDDVMLVTAQGRAMNETEAYKWELNNADKNGLTDLEQKTLTRRYNQKYNTLTPENKARADAGNFRVP